MLAGILTDLLDRRMTPSHAQKGSKRYRYYVTHASELREGEPAAHRLPAPDIEAAVVEQLRGWLSHAQNISRIIASQDAPIIASSIAAAERTALKLDTSYGRRSIVAGLVERVRLTDDAICIVLHRPALAAKVGTAISDDADLQLASPAVKVRQGQATKLVLASDSGRATNIDSKLAQLLIDARAAQRARSLAPEHSIKQVAPAQH